MDAVGDADPGGDPVIEVREEVDLAVRDADPREAADLVEVVEDVRLAQLVDLVEDDDARPVEVGRDAIEESPGRRGARECGADQVPGDLFEHRVSGVVLPAVHVGVWHLEDFLPELADGGAGDRRLPDAGGPEQEAVLGAEAVLDRRERVRDLVHVPIPADDRGGEVVVVKHRSVAYHVLVGDGVGI